MKMFINEKEIIGKSINFVDRNNVLVGFEFCPSCYETYGAAFLYNEIEFDEKSLYELAQNLVTIDVGQCAHYNKLIEHRKGLIKEIIDEYTDSEEIEELINKKEQEWVDIINIQFYNATGDFDIFFEDYNFDPNYLRIHEEKSEKGICCGGVVCLKLVLKNAKDIYLHLWNFHNGFYVHNLEWKGFNCDGLVESI